MSWRRCKGCGAEIPENEPDCITLEGAVIEITLEEAAVIEKWKDELMREIQYVSDLPPEVKTAPPPSRLSRAALMSMGRGIDPSKYAYSILTDEYVLIDPVPVEPPPPEVTFEDLMSRDVKPHNVTTAYAKNADAEMVEVEVRREESEKDRG